MTKYRYSKTNKKIFYETYSQEAVLFWGAAHTVKMVKTVKMKKIFLFVAT